MTPDLEHPSRKVTDYNDFDPPQAPQTTLHPLLRQFEQVEEIPLAPINMIHGPRPESRLQPHLLPVLQNCIREKGPSDACWTTQDKKGNTILNLAASRFVPSCVDWIPKRDFGDSLLQTRNHKGQTLLEFLQFKLKEPRTQKTAELRTVHISDKFRGHVESAIRCLLLLKRLGHLENLRESGNSGLVQQTIGGCTCGQRLDGFLSPRMLTALRFQAETGYDMFDNDFNDISEPDWVDLNADSLCYLPVRVLNNLRTNKSMRLGFVSLWKHIATCLERKIVPTEHNVFAIIQDTSEWPPVPKSFLGRGGSVGPTFLAICKGAIDQDEWTGNGEYQRIFAMEIEKLPDCRNDLEFGYVRGTCGYRRISMVRYADPWGSTLDEDGDRIKSMA